MLSGNKSVAPLAERCRPHTIDEVIGQTHLLGPGQPLRVAIESGTPHSMILWGPPGVGKTTLARGMAQAFNAEFVSLSAVFSGIKEIRAAIEVARIQRAHDRRTLVFVDEVHRFNKSQQDAFLPHVESGQLIFIGATTENPSFEINSALLSRTTVYALKSLNADELDQVLDHACSVLNGSAITALARHALITAADGDARQLLNTLEMAAHAASVVGVAQIDVEHVSSVLGAHRRRFDKGGDAFFEQISALHKSVRGSHPDAALYWFCRMLDGGADPNYLARRIIRIAWEDIGLADPRAARIALDAAETWRRLGAPEGELALAQALLYLCAAPKSNAGYRAYTAARHAVAQDASRPVPAHLRNAPTRLMKEFGYGRHYRNPHYEPHAYAAGEQYLPDGMPDPHWYAPTAYGLEAKIAEKLAQLRALDAGTSSSTFTSKLPNIPLRADPQKYKKSN